MTEKSEVLRRPSIVAHLTRICRFAFGSSSWGVLFEMNGHDKAHGRRRFGRAVKWLTAKENSFDIGRA